MSEYIPHRVREWSPEDLGTIAANAAAVFAVVSRGPTGEPSLMSAGVPAGCGQEGSEPEVLLLEPRIRSKRDAVLNLLHEDLADALRANDERCRASHAECVASRRSSRAMERSGRFCDTALRPRNPSTPPG
jgi:hypothetical protein